MSATDSMSAGERRKHPRLPIRQSRIRNGLLSGRVLNMSLGGVAVETTTGLRIGSRHRFRVAFDEERLRLEGRVRWCRLTRTVRQGEGEVVAIFRAGLSFTEPLAAFLPDGPQNSGEWFAAKVDVRR